MKWAMAFMSGKKPELITMVGCICFMETWRG